MKNLPELQQLFYRSIINNSDDFVSEVEPQGEPNGMSALERVEIYIDAYRLRLIEVLQDSFPALYTLMGDDDFDTLCLSYIDRYPSTYFSVRQFGHRLADHLIKERLLAEMASFEWALRFSFDAKDQKPLTLNDLAVLAPEQWVTLRFKLHPSLRTVNLCWNVVTLWKAIEQGSEPQSPKLSEDSLTWLIWRPELETQFRSMSEAETRAFRLIEKGQNFGQLCDALADDELVSSEAAANEAAQYLGRWIEDGLLVSYTHAYEN